MSLTETLSVMAPQGRSLYVFSVLISPIFMITLRCQASPSAASMDRATLFRLVWFCICRGKKLL